MADLEPSQGPGNPPPLDRPPRQAWFAGVLEGGFEDRHALEAAAHRVIELGVASADIEITGGRFSLLFDDHPIETDRLRDDKLAALLGELQQVVGAARPGSVESNLRCSLVYDTFVVETLFAVREGGQLEPISRQRPLAEDDRERLAEVRQQADRSVFSDLGVGRAVLLLALVFITSGFVAWQQGYIETLRGAFFGAPADQLLIDPSAFGDSVQLQAESAWASYRCTLRRGTNYPSTADAVEAWLQSAESAAERAAASAVGDGRTIQVALLDEDGKRLAKVPLSTAELLTDADAKIQVLVPARLGGVRLRLEIASTTKR